MISAFFFMCLGGAIVYVFPRVATFGLAVFKRLRAWWGKIGK